MNKPADVKWVKDVLADMREFAQMNDLPRLAQALEHAADIAAIEAPAPKAHKFLAEMPQ